MVSHSTKKNRGAFYTPPMLARYIVELTLAPLLAETSTKTLKILDPACGDGVFLRACYEYLAAPRHKLPPAARLAALHGVDIEPGAVRAAQASLRSCVSEAASSAEDRVSGLEAQLSRQIRLGDALLDLDRLASDSTLQACHPFSWQQAFPEVFLQPVAGFDAIVANPPYVNIRVLSKSRGSAFKAFLRDRYHSARGAYDIYVLFVERALELLRPGGMLGMIIPNKFASMEYAHICREIVRKQTTLVHVSDVSGGRLFPEAGVYPYIFVWKKQPPCSEQTVEVRRISAAAELEPPVGGSVIYRNLTDIHRPDGLYLEPGLELETLVPTTPLGQIARLNSGTAGFSAQRVGAELREWTPEQAPDCHEFIVSGNVDRYRIYPGKVRYMKRVFERPMLSLPCSAISATKGQLFKSRKIVVAGMGKRLESALDTQGYALGVQIYAVWQSQYDLRYLLAILNSKLISYVFRNRFQAKRLAGGYLSVNKGQLEQLPVARLSPDSPQQKEIYHRILSTVDARLDSTDGGTRGHAFETALDQELDELVYRVYNLSKSQVAQVEQSLDPNPCSIRS